MLSRLLAATAALLVAPIVAAPASAAEPIMPLAEVRPGMRCEGLTVVRGTDISSFTVDVIDVVTGNVADGQPLLLVRVSGPAADTSGIAEGFSGAPVICPGADGTRRIAGAIAYGSGDYGNKVGFATPIEQLLGMPLEPPAGAARVHGLRPLATPLTLSGVSPAVAAPFVSALARAGRTLSVAPVPPAGSLFPVQELRPGASVSAGLAAGDIELGAIGTVSYTDGAKVWAFGHPLDGTGRRSLFLQDAFVYTVIDNPLGVGDAVSRKLAAAGHVLGTVTSDGRSGIGGLLGAPPPSTHLSVTTRDDDTGALRTLNAQVADETDVGLPLGFSPLTVVGPIALSQAAYTALDGSPVRQSGSLCVRITIAQLRRPAGFCNTYTGAFGGATPDGGTTGGPYVSDLAEALSAIDAFQFGKPQVTRVEAELHVARGLRQAWLLGVDAPDVVRRGETVRLRLRLQHVRGTRFTRDVPLRIPRDVPRGERTIVLTGTPADGAPPPDQGESSPDAMMTVPTRPDDGAGPKTYAALARQIARIARPDGVTVSFRPPAGGEQADESPRAQRERRLVRDPALRISGLVRTRLTVR